MTRRHVLAGSLAAASAGAALAEAPLQFGLAPVFLLKRSIPDHAPWRV